MVEVACADKLMQEGQNMPDDDNTRQSIISAVYRLTALARHLDIWLNAHADLSQF